jgi:hypothetical protein
MAGKTVLIRGLVLGASHNGPDKQRHGKRLNEELSGKVHEFEEILSKGFIQ